MNLNSSRWYQFLINQGISIEQSLILSDYAERLKNNRVPVIFELTHLSRLLGVERELIKRIISHNENFYRVFSIPKKSGGTREIRAPYPKLHYIQKWIKNNILDFCPKSHSAYAYIKGLSNIDYAKKHLQANEIYKVDIQNFFGSINYRSVKAAFLSVGYSSKVSEDLASICTVYDCLPQGAPTSPDLSNIILFELDQRLSELSAKYKCVYTRYADDFCFSGDNIEYHFIQSINHILKENGFDVNENKTRKLLGSNRKLVTGLMINNNTLRVPKKTRREYRKNAHYLIKNGIKSFDGTIGKLDPLYVDRIIGKGSYILKVEPDNAYVKDTIDKLIEIKKTLTK